MRRKSVTECRKTGFARCFPRKLRVKSIRQNIFARTIKGFGGEGRLLCVTGSKFDRSFCPFVNFFVSLDTSFRAHYFIAAPLSRIFVGRRNERMDDADYAPVKLIYAACLCTRAKPDCSNKRTTSDLTDIIYTAISVCGVPVRTCTTTLIAHVTPLYSFISFILVRETVLTCVYCDVTIDL